MKKEEVGGTEGLLCKGKHEEERAKQEVYKSRYGGSLVIFRSHQAQPQAPVPSLFREPEIVEGRERQIKEGRKEGNNGKENWACVVALWSGFCFGGSRRPATPGRVKNRESTMGRGRRQKGRWRKKGGRRENKKWMEKIL